MSYAINQGTLVFNGINSQNFGVWLKGGGTYNAPARQYSSVTIPGRNGTLTLDSGAFEEAEHNYEAFIVNDFPSNIEGLRSAFLSSPGYHRLEDSYHTDEYYMAKYMDGLEVEPAPLAVGGAFALRFRRDPRRFLKSGETSATVPNGGSVSNPTSFPSQPLIKVTGYGTLYVGSQQIVIAQHFAFVNIDCEMMDCYSGTENANPYVTMQGNNFPELQPGTTGITYSGNITKVEITPRWWRI